MPRTTTVESPGCPPLRALTFDALGLVKVVESREGERAAAKMVERWGDPDASKCVLAASILDREFDPLLGIARKCGLIDVISAVNGELRIQIPSSCQSDEDAVVGLHLFKKHQSDSSSKSCKLFSCTRQGKTNIEAVEIGKNPTEFIRDPSPAQWSVCGSGSILCSKVHENESYALFGGKGVEMNIWDVHECVKIWAAKSPPKNNLGIFTPTCFTSATFLSKDDHRKFLAGTELHQVRLYDTSAQRRPVMSIDYRETAIKAISEDSDGHTIYIGNGSGDLASFDMRTGKLVGSFIGKCSGSIRSISRHPELPVIASCGLDSYLRIWDIESRQLLSAVFLKQHILSVVFHSHFRDKEVGDTVPAPEKVSTVDASSSGSRSAKRKKDSREKKHSSKKMKSKKRNKKLNEDEDDDDD